MIDFRKDIKICLPNGLREEILNHCIRKLSGKYYDGETFEKQAYGLLGGKFEKDVIYIEKQFACKKNYRNHPTIQPYINKLVTEYAIEAATPIDERGWVAHPDEVLIVHGAFDDIGLQLVGSYHMHHDDSWKGSYPKKYPSQFDKKLAENTNLPMFIVSIDPLGQHSIAAYFNGVKENEIEIIENVPMSI